MSYANLAPNSEALVEAGESVRKVAGGFAFTEGPIWHPRDQYLLFSDIQGDVRRRWDESGAVREVSRPANKGNGMTYDAELDLLVCEHATSTLARVRADGQREVLASHFEGKELNSPNDVCVRSDGSIYFTDPPYGRTAAFGVERTQELGWQGVYRLAPDGVLRLVVAPGEFAAPNGLCFSPDESRLYVDDTERALIRVYDVAPNGSLRNGRLFAEGLASELERGRPDGIKTDERGNVWCTGPGGVWIFAPTGERIGRIATPEPTANLHWGGADFHTLFLTAGTSLYGLKTRVGPHVEPFMRQ